MEKKYIILLLLTSKLFGLGMSGFSHPSIHSSGDKITELALIGQRCSGTNFIQGLMKANFPSYFFNHPINQKQVPHKHHWPVVDNVNDFPFLRKDNCLFVLVVRDPYNWLKSLFSHKELLPHQDRTSFYNFISTKFHYPHIPEKTSFQNILDARNLEMKNFLTIGMEVKNFLFVRYEDVVKNPEQFIGFVSECFELTKKEPFVAINTYKDSGNQSFEPKKYAPISSSDLELVNNSLNWEMETFMGYSLKSSDEKNSGNMSF
ncbi:MAG: hypothetical protein WD055_02605 [Candidatus Dependentiae bacterium]